MIALLIHLGVCWAGGELELALERFGAAKDASDLGGMQAQAGEALALAPEDWRAHLAWQQAQAQRRWWLDAEYAALLSSEDPDLALMGEWYRAQRQHLLPAAPEGCDSLTAAQVRARVALDLGQAQLALASLERGADPTSTALRLEALWVEGEQRALRQETREALELWPDRVDLGAWLWTSEGAAARVSQRGVVRSAEAALAGDDVLALYRAHALLVAAEETEAAAEAAARLLALGEPYPLGSRPPWASVMIRELGRALTMQRTPKPPPGGTPHEDVRVLAATARELGRKERHQRAADVWRQAMEIEPDNARLLVQAAAGLEEAQAPTQEVLQTVAAARVALAQVPALGEELEQQRAALAELAWVEARALRRAGDLEAALVSAEIANQLGAPPEALALQGDICEQLGLTDAAFAALARAHAAGAEVSMARLEQLYIGPASAEVVIAALPTPATAPAPAPKRRGGPPKFPVASLNTNQGVVDLTGDGVVIVAFWASWCGPCAQELPALDRVVSRLIAEGVAVQVVAISVDDEEREAGRWLHDHPLSIPTGWDPELSRTLGVTSLPSTYVVGPGGVVRGQHQGYVAGDEDRIEEEVRVILQAGIPTP